MCAGLFTHTHTHTHTHTFTVDTSHFCLHKATPGSCVYVYDVCAKIIQIKPTRWYAGALLRAPQARKGPAARRSRGALQVKLSVIVVVISYPRAVHRLNRRRGSRHGGGGGIESVAVVRGRRVQRVAPEVGEQHPGGRAPVQQHGVLAAGSGRQNAVYAEHTSGHVNVAVHGRITLRNFFLKHTRWR